jgi:hypothetical protein
MALRLKTIEYAFELSTASVASATARDFTQIAALAIPETSSRTFRSVTLEVSLIDNGTTAVSVTAVLMGVALGAVAINTATVTQTIANSGENQAWVFSRDMTSYFVTNYTGTSMTADARVTVTGPITSNASAKLIITYQYDDSSATTRIKTVKIPMDGNTANLTTSFTNMGGVANQIPALDTFLPEASKTYRDIFFQIEGHTGTGTTTGAAILNMRYDGATTVADLSHAHTLASDVAFRRIDKLLGAITTNATHSVEANTTSTAGGPYPCLCGYLVVTYEYDHANSTTIMNSIQVATMDEAGWCGGTVTGDKSRFTRDFSIQEPETITLVQSGVMCIVNDAGVVTLDLRLGSQAARTFTHPATLHCGAMPAMRRLDSGAVGGAGITLTHGFNTLVVDWFTSSATAGNLGSNMSGLVFLNYTSGKHSEGDGAHVHTTHWCIRAHATGNLVQRLQVSGLTTPVIPETNYWISGVSFQIILITSGTSTANLAIAMQVEVQSSEAEGAGWRPMYNALYASDTEMGMSLLFCRARTEFMRWPAEPDTSRMNVQTARSYRYDVNVTASCFWQSAMLLTYHSITYTIAGTVTGSSDGTVNLKAHLAAEAGATAKGTEIASTSRAGNGAYSMTWYDNTIDVFTEAWESSTLIGRSDDDIAA